MSTRLVVYGGVAIDLATVVHELARALGITDAAAKELIDRIETDGLVEIACTGEEDAVRRFDALPAGVVARIVRGDTDGVEILRQGFKTAAGFDVLDGDKLSLILALAQERRHRLLGEDQPPLLALESVPTRLDRFALRVAVAVAIATPIAIMTGMVPFVWNGSGVPGPFTIVVTVGAALAPLALFYVLRAPPTGFVEIYPDEILFKTSRYVTDRSAAHVRWDEIAAFDDGSAEAIAIVVRDGGRRRIPTPTEEARTKLLALLDEKGVVRAG